MKTARLVVAIWVAALLLAVATPARAQSTIEECQARLDLIQMDLNTIFYAGGIGGNNPQQTYDSLTSKIVGASTKLGRKNADALQKLQDFKTAVTTMRDAAKPKLSGPDAALLLDGAELEGGVNGAITCIALLP